jgi:hypothetical protein
MPVATHCAERRALSTAARGRPDALFVWRKIHPGAVWLFVGGEGEIRRRRRVTALTSLTQSRHSPLGESMSQAKADSRAFSEQRANCYQLPRAKDSDRLMTNRMPGSTGVAASIAAEWRETWYCDAAMNPFTHPTITQYLYSTPEAAREHSSRISSVDILFAGKNWAVADRHDLQ